MKLYTLRVATPDDLEFLFDVSTEDMRPVVEQLHPGEVFDREQELQKYKEKFVPDEIQVSSQARVRVRPACGGIATGEYDISSRPQKSD